MADKRENARSLLAADLEHGHLTGFLTFRHIAAKILTDDKDLKPSFVAGLKYLVGLHGFAKIVGPFYGHILAGKGLNLELFEAAIKGFQPFLEILFKHISHDHDEVATTLEELVSPEDSARRVVTWDNLVHAFPYRELDTCVTESRAEATRAATEETDAPEAEVVEEVMEVEPSADGKPTGK